MVGVKLVWRRKEWKQGDQLEILHWEGPERKGRKNGKVRSGWEITQRELKEANSSFILCFRSSLCKKCKVFSRGREQQGGSFTNCFSLEVHVKLVQFTVKWCNGMNDWCGMGRAHSLCPRGRVKDGAVHREPRTTAGQSCHVSPLYAKSSSMKMW